MRGCGEAILLFAVAQGAALLAQETGRLANNVQLERGIPYAEPKNQRQMLDIYTPATGKNLPVVVCIHGGGWRAGDKTQVASKPLAFTQKGLIFAAVNYRFVPNVTMETIVRDVAKSIRWVHDHAGSRRGDPNRIFVMGHSAGAQLAALICTDDRYLKAEGLSLSIVKGCVPVDGDTYDVPLQIATTAARRNQLGQPEPKMGYAEKFGPPDRQRELSAVRHIARNKGIPPFLILHVADHTDTTAQAHRLWSELQEAGVPAKTYGAEATDHVRLDRDLGLPGDAATTELFAFVDAALGKRARGLRGTGAVAELTEKVRPKNLQPPINTD
jgi:acetyl esterase/lipase